jgi:hypothetical protein
MIFTYLNWSYNKGKWNWKFIDSDYSLPRSGKPFRHGRGSETYKMAWRMGVIIMLDEKGGPMAIDMAVGTWVAKHHMRLEGTGEMQDMRVLLDETCTRHPGGMSTSAIWIMDRSAHPALGSICWTHTGIVTALLRAAAVGENLHTMMCLLD